ncbi:ABC transporter substrate-binding protein [Nitratidesulfovibrio sp. SRB-5]|uniref:ABC transporter substrate-binding protein n=1 Tax=Nitratidesulfovibrio sp. SRB-5 TaxID=2872636 RepID=UPI00102757EB|nr:ABC transporter substrate-binding protein [Nitratidesulfovibrio sp. SRB-5]MBZ2170945.1 ABC transporter substrate-binding protein [Nitratidesulfovibrio sp. SRB-5]RXF77868.1 ABC transporter substrate-binding protein [Desulfovibrio sp. DS-1]
MAQPDHAAPGQGSVPTPGHISAHENGPNRGIQAGRGPWFSRRVVLAAVAVAVIGMLLTATLTLTREPATVRIGFVGQLEGLTSDLGVQGRNGAQLAVEHLNAAGGVAGRRLELVAEHDGNTPEEARAAVSRLLARKVQAGVGHMTSGQTVAALPLWEAAGVPLISPTTSAPALEGREDGFFRVIPANTTWAEALAVYARSTGLREMAVVRETANAPFSTPFAEAFVARFRELGGTVAADLPYAAADRKEFAQALRHARQSAASGVLLVCPARDVAMAAQGFHRDGFFPALFSSSWGYTRELLLAGGSDVEGIVFAHAYAADLDDDSFRNFQAAYTARFGWMPNFAAAFGYEAVMVLGDALARAGGDPSRLRETLPEVRNLTGVLGPISLDRYGDVHRRSFILTIRDGEFATLQ